jgi:acyl carrier protein
VPTEMPKNFAPLDRDGVFVIVRDQLVDILETDPENISEGQSFKDDLNADSLALVELVDALERTIGFRIEDDDLADLKTVRDAVDFVYAHVVAHGQKG